MKRPIIQIFSRHDEKQSGAAPDLIAGQDGCATYFFENDSSEQFLLIVDRRNSSGLLYVGEKGWSEPIAFENVLALLPIVFSAEEAAWLRNSWLAATGRGLPIYSPAEIVEFAAEALRNAE